MGFNYEAMDQAKQKIQKVVNAVNKRHLTIYIFIYSVNGFET